MRYWQGLLSFSQLSRLIRLGGRPQANWICLDLINSGRPIARKTETMPLSSSAPSLFLFKPWQRKRCLFFPAKGVFPNSQMKRPAKSNYETVVAECSDFNQTAFNLPDPPKSVHIKTEQQEVLTRNREKQQPMGAREDLETTSTMLSYCVFIHTRLLRFVMIVCMSLTSGAGTWPYKAKKLHTKKLQVCIPLLLSAQVSTTPDFFVKTIHPKLHDDFFYEFLACMLCWELSEPLPIPSFPTLPTARVTRSKLEYCAYTLTIV